MPVESETSQSFETLEGYQRQCKCDIRGEDIKKWRDAVIVLKNNNIFVYKNESAKTPQVWICLDKCLVMTAPEFEGKTNVIQLKTFTGRIFCFALPSNENINDWVTDIKASDYTSIKEKVTTLEEGLQAIGSAQDAKAKEDREKMILQRKQQAITSIKQVRESIHKSILYQVFIMWKSQCDYCKQVENLQSKYEGEIQSLQAQSQQQISELSTELEKTKESTTTQVNTLSKQMNDTKKQACISRLNSLLKDQQKQQQYAVFYQWIHSSCMNALTTMKDEQLAEKEKMIQELQQQLEKSKEEVTTLQQSLQQKEADALKEKEELIHKHEDELRCYADIVKEHTAVKSQLDELISQKEELEEKNQSLSSQIEQMGTSLATFQEAAKGSADDVQAIVARLQLQVNDLTVQLETSHKDEEEYRRKWEMLQEFSVDELARAQKKIDELTATCSELIKQVEEANNDEKMNDLIRQLEIVKKEKDDMNNHISNLNLQIKATEDVVTNSSTIAIERENEMKELEAKNTELTTSLTETTQMKEELEKQLEKMKEEDTKKINELEEKNKTQGDELNKLKRRVLALKNMEENMQDVEDQLEQREKQLKDVLERIKKAEKTSEECKKEVKRYEALNAELEHRMSNYLFRESEAGEVLEKQVEVFIDKPETLEKIKELEMEINSMKETITNLENTIQKKKDEEKQQLERNESFKSKKTLPMKFFPLYPSLIPTQTKGPGELPKKAVIAVEERPDEEKEPIKRFAGRNPDVVRREEEERKRKEEEERKRREEEERKRREEEERKRREEEERKRREEEERKRKEEEERKKREEEERKRREEEERKRREEEEKRRKEHEEEERKKREEEEKQRKENEPLSPNPFDEVEEEKPTSPNPFDDEVEEERHSTPNPFDDEVEEQRPATPNPFDDEVEEERPAIPNPFDEVEEERPATPNPFDDEVKEEKPLSPNPFDDEVEEQRPASPNPFDEVKEQRPASPNPFDEVKEERPASPNPFDSTAMFTQDTNTSVQPQEQSNPFQEQSNPFQEQSNPFQEQSNPFQEQEQSNPFQEQEQSNPFQDEANPFQEQSNPFQEQSNPFQEQEQSNPFQEQSNPFQEQSNPFQEQSNPFQDEANPFQEQTDSQPAIDLSSFLTPEEAPKQEKKSLWKSFTTSRNKQEKTETSSSTVPVEENKRKWGFSEKQKDAIKGGMGRFSNMIKSAADKGRNVVKKRNTAEPAQFPSFASDELMEGMHSKPVEYFFANWNYADDEKKNIFEWIQIVVENQSLTEKHMSGLVIPNASFFAEEGFRTCLIPLMNMRENVNVDFAEVPAENGTFTITIRVLNKIDPVDDLLSGF